MSLERVVAAPFKQAGTDCLSQHEFVVALSLHRDWFSPAQAKRVVDLATSEGMLDRTDDGLVPMQDPREVTIPSGFSPGEDVLTRRSTFEAILETLVEAGCDKREAVGSINRLQRELGITIEAAAVVYATTVGVEVEDHAERAQRELLAEQG